MNLLDNVFNTDKLEINMVNKKYLIVFCFLIILLVIILLIKKDYYYENNLILGDERIILLVDKDKINEVKNKKKVLINEIESDYSINKIIDEENVCYVDIKLYTNITNISNQKYKILLGKETIFEYIIRIIRKISWKK